jgi:hypothetical protein
MLRNLKLSQGQMTLSQHRIEGSRTQLSIINCCSFLSMIIRRFRISSESRFNWGKAIGNWSRADSICNIVLIWSELLSQKFNSDQCLRTVTMLVLYLLIKRTSLFIIFIFFRGRCELLVLVLLENFRKETASPRWRALTLLLLFLDHSMDFIFNVRSFEQIRDQVQIVSPKTSDASEESCDLSIFSDFKRFLKNIVSNLEQNGRSYSLNLLCCFLFALFALLNTLDLTVVLVRSCTNSNSFHSCEINSSHS